MGSCFSSSSSSAAAEASAKVIDANGSLIEYSQPVEVSHVLGLNHRAFFLCNADDLFYGHHIQPLEANHLIELGKLYFFLPSYRLNRPLKAAEMAALAVRVNSALADAILKKKKKKNSFWRRKRRKGIQVMPVITAMESDGYESFNESSVGSWNTERGGMKSDEVKQRALRRGKMAVKRPFKPTLSSIEEAYE